MGVVFYNDEKCTEKDRCLISLENVGICVSWESHNVETLRIACSKGPVECKTSRVLTEDIVTGSRGKKAALPPSLFLGDFALGSNHFILILWAPGLA